MNSTAEDDVPTPSDRVEAADLLGSRLVDAGFVSDEDVVQALDFQRRFGGRLGAVLIRMGAISEENLLPVLSAQLDLPVAGEDDIPGSAEAVIEAVNASGLRADWWLDVQACPWEAPDGRIVCAARDPLEPALGEMLDRSFGGRNVTLMLARNQDMDRLLETVERASHRAREAADDDIGRLRELAEEAPVIELVNNILSQAVDQGASDIHVEPEERRFHVRLRIDGVLHTRYTLPLERFAAVASRIKLISGMDIAERRLPQDGRVSLRISGDELDVRVSAVPGVHGESLVMRLLPKESQQLRLQSLGFADDHYRLFRQWSASPHGIILVTGPTGSGKSTTLYATLDEINERDRKIITVEDPVEYELAGVTQIQTHAEIGYTFARALRAILRQDPDIVMIGEIRDLETAEIAVQAALTGHLVLSTLHTNDSVAAFTRLVDMGVEPFLVATSVRAVQAQRLVRRVCGECAEPESPHPRIREAALAAAERAALSTEECWRVARGCHACRGTGYRGRTGIYELVDVSEAIQDGVMAGHTAHQLWRTAAGEGARSLRDDGLVKALHGITTVDEVIRVSGANQHDEAT
jgi:general secretion pathway protein E